MERALFSRLDDAFDRALVAALRGVERATVLYSGGVDSSLVAHGARACGSIRLSSVGAAGAEDLRAAESGAALLGLPFQATVVGPDDVAGALRRHDLAAQPEPGRSVQVSLALALRTSGPGRVLVGQGADELFGGYAHFRGLPAAAAEERRESDWRRLVAEDWPVTLGIARELGCELRAPFLDPAFAEAARSAPLVPLGEAAPTKPTLRAWATHRALPEEIVQRPKRAMQYGSGIARLVRKAAPF